MAVSNANIIAKYLEDAGIVGGVSGWVCYSNKLPSSPDKVVVVYNTTPRLEGRAQGATEQAKHPGIAITIRGTSDYNVGENQAQEVRDALLALKKTFVTLAGEDFRIQCFKMTSDVTFIAEEESNKRNVFTVNGTITIKPE